MEETESNMDAHGNPVEPKLRAFWVWYPATLPSSHGREAWAAHSAKELVGLLNETYPAEHTLANVAEVSVDELADPDILERRGQTVAGILASAQEPGRLFELYSPEPHPAASRAR